MGDKIQCLDKGFVQLISCPDDDLTVVNAARVSFGKESEWVVPVRNQGFDHRTPNPSDKTLSDRDTKLIRYLARGMRESEREAILEEIRTSQDREIIEECLRQLDCHPHFTPFAHPQIRFRIKMPVFVARQLMRSNVGVVWNEVSRRYLDGDALPLEFYEPTEWRGRPDKGIKQGSGGPLERLDMKAAASCAAGLNGRSVLVYEDLTALGVAPEMARMILPQSLYTEVITTMSLYAASRIYKQRIDSHAQWEIQQYAKAMGELIGPRFHVSWAALTEG